MKTMETMKLYRKIDDIYDEVKDNNIFVACKKLEELKQSLYIEEKQKNLKGSRKKAISKITSISKKILKGNRPVLSYQKKINDMYCFTDSYFLTMTKDSFLPVFDDLTEKEKKNKNIDYPDVERIINIDQLYECDLKEIDFNDIEVRRKTKDENLMFTDLIFKGKKNVLNSRRDKTDTIDIDFTRRFNNEYLMIAYNLLDIKNNINDIVCYTNSSERLTPCIIKNIITKEFILILPIRICD